MAALERPPGAAPIESPPNPMVYYPAPPRHGSGFNLVAGLLLAILLLLAAVAGAFFVLVASLTGWGGRTVGDAGQQAATAARTATDALGRAGQEARDRLDPSHPPRDALAYDAEIEDFVKLGVGQNLSMSRTRSVTL